MRRGRPETLEYARHDSGYVSRYVIRRAAEGDALADAFAVRRAVFVDEQDVPEGIEMDEYDAGATHFVAYDTARGEPVGTARLRFPEEATGKAERVAVLRPYRGEGLGTRLMERVESDARNRGCSRVRLNAQTHVEEFYTDLGYETVSDVFYEAGIPHVEMVTDL
jgi:predicted GNAT family N-acyltransferase